MLKFVDWAMDHDNPAVSLAMALVLISTGALLVTLSVVALVYGHGWIVLGLWMALLCYIVVRLYAQYKAEDSK